MAVHIAADQVNFLYPCRVFGIWLGIFCISLLPILLVFRSKHIEPPQVILWFPDPYDADLFCL